MKISVYLNLLLAFTLPVMAASLPRTDRKFIEQHCVECHDTDTDKAGLDLTTFKFEPTVATNFSRWVLIHDRVAKGEMPPKKKPRPEAAELETFTNTLGTSLVKVERARLAKEGRATRRRLNRYEYENALRDLLHAPWLQVRRFVARRRRGGSASTSPATLSTFRTCNWRAISARQTTRSIKSWPRKPNGPKRK